VERVQEHIKWEGRLRRALGNDQFLLLYQPLLRLSDNSTPGYEALLRMEDREGKLISPGLFLESAECFGLSAPIDYMVIRKAARKIAALPGNTIWISLNLSRTSLDDAKLFHHIEDVVAENALMPGQLHIEITESAAMEFLDQVRTLIVKLKAIGCRVVLDDFGRGPAYHYLQQLPVDMVKIDGDLIRGLSTHENNRTLVKNITEVAHEKGIQVTAKHVEDEALVDILRELDVDYAQGFAIGRPVEAIEQMQSFVSATED
jgi:EAL domain-containing protein (putative c-di-GMP-specific phosphodiesterase class I)